jgi:hypothetical protein
MPKYVFARDDVSFAGPGFNRYHTRKGEAFRSTHPAVVARPDLFSDEPTVFHDGPPEPEVEQATAAPGERRGIRR